MKSIDNKTIIYKIPIRVSSYEDLFNSLDYRELSEREINEEVDNLIDKSILKSDKKIKDIKLELIIHLPKKAYNINDEIKASEGIKRHYNSFFKYKKRINEMGIRRIIYYTITAFILLTCWYLLEKYDHNDFFASLLNAGGTVLLWEMMSLILIERKNYEAKISIRKKLLDIKIVFKYF